MTSKEGERDEFVLSSGRQFYANCGIIGLSPHDDHVHEGYDGPVWMDMDDDTWTPEEKRELATYMIALWMRWRERV